MFVHIWLAASRYMYVATALSWLRATLRVDEKCAADLTPPLIGPFLHARG
jgi:hypothetical protein